MEAADRVGTPDERIILHLREYLGAWPPTRPVEVTTCALRTRPGWNGGVVPFFAVSSPMGTVVSVPPDRVTEARRILGAEAPGPDMRRLAVVARRAAGRPGHLSSFVLRWVESFELPDEEFGVWLADDDPRRPAWLEKYTGGIVAVLHDDAVVAVAARKRHDRWAHELMVDTMPGFRNRGYSRALAAQMVGRIVAEGALPFPARRPDNAPAAKVGDAIGLVDHGFRTHEWVVALPMAKRLRSTLSRARRALPPRRKPVSLPG